MLQPEWRKDSIEGSLIFCHDVPIGETWQGMRKGGTAGIYIIVMALSWWIKAQKAKRDVEAWSTVNELLWVIQQLNKKTVSPIIVPKKQVHDENGVGEDEAQRKRYASSVFFRYVCSYFFLSLAVVFLDEVMVFISSTAPRHKGFFFITNMISSIVVC